MVTQQEGLQGPAPLTRYHKFSEHQLCHLLLSLPRTEAPVEILVIQLSVGQPTQHQHGVGRSMQICSLPAQEMSLSEERASLALGLGEQKLSLRIALTSSPPRPRQVLQKTQARAGWVPLHGILKMV